MILFIVYIVRQQVDVNSKNVMRNDSLFSYTETRLDALYKVSRETKRTLIKFENKVTFASNPDDKMVLDRKVKSKKKELGEQSE